MEAGDRTLGHVNRATGTDAPHGEYQLHYDFAGNRDHFEVVFPCEVWEKVGPDEIEKIRVSCEELYARYCLCAMSEPRLKQVTPAAILDECVLMLGNNVWRRYVQIVAAEGVTHGKLAWLVSSKAQDIAFEER